MKSNWLHKIQQHKATPPEGAWKNIANTLDNEAAENVSFAERLSAFETAPPASAQKNIFAQLGAENISFDQRLRDYEITAPQKAWPNIISQLENRETKVIPLEPRWGKLKTLTRIAAAIALITVISIVVIFLNKKNPISDQSPLAGTEQQPAPNTLPGYNPVTPLPVNDTQQEKKTIAVKQTKVTNTTNADYANAPAYVSHNLTTALAQNPAALKKEKLQDINGLIPQDVTLVNNTAASAYITITGPDGQSVRVSSKLSALINYLTDTNPDTQENIEIIIKESAKWRATFSAWRDKMTNNNIAPSLTNFMDIIELSNVLEEKK